MKYLLNNSATQAEKLRRVKDILTSQIVYLYESGELSLKVMSLLSKLGLLEKPGFALWGASIVKKIEESSKVLIVFNIEEGDGNNCEIEVSHHSLPLVDWGTYLNGMEGNTSDGLCILFTTNKDEENSKYYFIEDKETECETTELAEKLLA